ncbi:MAG: exodeoxyribonuclease I [Pseudohongiellaceae bacterium]
MTERTLYWYDYETFGVDPRRDRAAQFAGMRTTESLEPIGQPLVLYCQPADDFLPSPEACLITHITPQLAQQRGVGEAEFIRRILEEFSRPGTCVAGYNNLRFDDELTRQLLYRNFHDPYEREWKNGNSRWDLIDMMRLCAATRPEGIEWPRNDEGNVSFRLDRLTQANAISHGNAHDALADVQATIAIASLVKTNQPRLYDYVYSLRSKPQVEAQLDTVSRKPVLHVSSRYPAGQGCLALVSPLCRHPTDSNGIVVCDLRMDPDQWTHLSAEAIQARVFTRQEDLPEDSPRIPLKVIHVNRCPVVAPATTLEPELARRYGVDLEAVQRHWHKLQGERELSAKLAKVFAQKNPVPETDPDFMIYSGGFFSESDRRLMALVRGSNAEQLSRLDIPFKDARLPEMLFRYRARNFPHTLNQEEQQHWHRFRRQRLADPQMRDSFEQSMESARKLCTTDADHQVLDNLQKYVTTLLAGVASQV